MRQLRKRSIPERQWRWYVRHVESFIKAQNGRPIKSLRAADVSAYLDVLGREGRLAGWQFSQAVTAIRILCCDLLASAPCREVDWQYWLDSARTLGPEHPTTARQLSPAELSYMKERKGQGPLQQVRAAHRDVLVRFTTEVRRRGYAYRTEQSYEQWICRYIAFCTGGLPAVLSRPPRSGRFSNFSRSTAALDKISPRWLEITRPVRRRISARDRERVVIDGRLGQRRG